MNLRVAAAILCGAVVASSAVADDSSAVLGAGGLVLVKSAAVRMAREDLTVSPLAVHVRYEFVNDSGKDIETIVAFPLPDIDLYEFSGEAIGTIKNQTPNFVGFALKVDGRTVHATAEEKAMLKGKDVTTEVRAAGIPINMAGTNLFERLPKLSHDARAKLMKAGLMEIDGPNGDDIDGTDFHPRWTAQTKFWWQQKFPAHKTVVIEHSYQPVTGQSFFSPEELNIGEAGNYYTKSYCLDPGTKARVRDLFAALKRAHPDNFLLNTYSTDFVLTTAGNWKGPIGFFHMTLDKLKPENVLSLCWDGDLKKMGPATFEFTRANFAPKRDVRMLVLWRPAQ
jgi:hypothetical protein